MSIKLMLLDEIMKFVNKEILMFMTWSRLQNVFLCIFHWNKKVKIVKDRLQWQINVKQNFETYSKNKLNIHSGVNFIFKCFAKKTTGQWTDTYVAASQRVQVKTVWMSVLFYFLSCFTFEESTGFSKIFDVRFSINLHVLRCPEHDLTIFRKCPSICLYVCLQNFVDTVTQELICVNRWNFVFTCTLI